MYLQYFSNIPDLRCVDVGYFGKDYAAATSSPPVSTPRSLIKFLV